MIRRDRASNRPENLARFVRASGAGESVAEHCLAGSAGEELSFFYAGESGRPFTFLAFGTLNRGDLNADGSNANDPVYVPRTALDSSKIRFTGFSDSTGADNSTSARAARERLQRIAFEDFVERTWCVRRQRGEIQKRNSCREPWSNTTIASLRQLIPIASRALEAQLDVFNVLNLLNGGWGHRREAAPALLEQCQPDGRSDTGLPACVSLQRRPDGLENPSR